MLITLLALTFTPPALAASAPVDCFVQAQADEEIFPLTKKRYENLPASTEVENALRNLCAGTSSAAAPLECFKEAMRNPDVMAATKRLYRGTVGEPALESAVATLCHATKR